MSDNYLHQQDRNPNAAWRVRDSNSPSPVGRKRYDSGDNIKNSNDINRGVTTLQHNVQHIIAPTPDYNNQSSTLSNSIRIPTSIVTNNLHSHQQDQSNKRKRINTNDSNITSDDDEEEEEKDILFSSTHSSIPIAQKANLIHKLPRKKQRRIRTASVPEEEDFNDILSPHWLRRELLVYMAKISTPIYKFISILCTAIGPSVNVNMFIKVFPHEVDSLSKRIPVSEGGIPHVNYGLKDFIIELSKEFKENPHEMMNILRNIIGNFHKSRRFVKVVGEKGLKRMLEEMDIKMKEDRMIERLRKILPKEEEENIVKLSFLPGEPHIFDNLTQKSKTKILEITRDTGVVISNLVSKLEEYAKDNKITNKELDDLLVDNTELTELLEMYKKALDKLKLQVIKVPVKREPTTTQSLIGQLMDLKTKRNFNIGGDNNDGRSPIFLPTTRPGGGGEEGLESEKYDEIVNWRRALDEIFRADRTRLALGEEEAGRYLGYLMLDPCVKGLIAIGTEDINKGSNKDFTEHELMYSPQVQTFFAKYLAKIYPGSSGNNVGKTITTVNNTNRGGDYNVFIKPGKTRYQIMAENKESQAPFIFFRSVYRETEGLLMRRKESSSLSIIGARERNVINPASIPTIKSRHSSRSYIIPGTVTRKYLAPTTIQLFGQSALSFPS